MCVYRTSSVDSVTVSVVRTISYRAKVVASLDEGAEEMFILCDTFCDNKALTVPFVFVAEVVVIDHSCSLTVTVYLYLQESSRLCRIKGGVLNLYT